MIITLLLPPKYQVIEKKLSGVKEKGCDQQGGKKEINRPSNENKEELGKRKKYISSQNLPKVPAILNTTRLVL